VGRTDHRKTVPHKGGNCPITGFLHKIRKKNNNKFKKKKKISGKVLKL